MFKRTCIVLLAMLVAFPLFSASDKVNFGKIDFILGNVSVKKLSGKTEKAKLNMKIYTGDKVITAQNSSAQIILGKNIKVRMAANSEFEVKKDEMNKANQRETVLGLNIGKIWASIGKLKKDEKFAVETPTAVAGVRGTILAVKRTEESTTLYVGAGLVSLLSKILGQEINCENGYMLSIGSDGKFSDLKQMTDQDKQDMMSGIPIFFQQGSGSLKDELKSEIDDEKSDLDKQRDKSGRLKSDDLTTGRTLKDIHGNVVRVEQVFRKSGANSFQILNITKRDDGLAYMDFTAYFNRELPKDFKNWGEFFINNDDVDLQSRTTLMGTKKPNKNLNETIKWEGYKKGDKFIDTFQALDPDGVPKGDLYYGDMDKAENKSSSDDLSSKTTIKLYKEEDKVTDSGKTIKINMYVIDNNGKVLSEKYFESNTNPLNIFSNIAGEIIVVGGPDSLIQGDIDVVAIPDIAFVIIQEIF